MFDIMIESRWSMYKKILIIVVSILLILTGCTRVSNDLDNLVNEIMKESISSVNTVSTGYELYIPIGVKQVSDSQYNQRFKIKDRYVYLYVDTISYYYKNTLNYKTNGDYNYYYKEISLDNKLGYIGINKLEDESFFCEVVYNYSKSEFYATSEDLSLILADVLIMQNSIKFNDELIKIELENSTSDGREVKYELDKPKDSESTFSKYLQEYVAEDDTEVELPDDN